MDSVADDRFLICRVSPFGNLRIDAYVPLPGAYRSLSRPSSAPDAKAFPLRSYSLNLVGASSISLAPAFPPELAHSAAPPLQNKTSVLFWLGTGNGSLRLMLGSLNYAGSSRIVYEIVLPCVDASSVSFAPPFPAGRSRSAASPFPRGYFYPLGLRRGLRRSLRSRFPQF